MLERHNPRNSAPLLELQGLKRHFGALKVIDGIDLQVRKGEVVGVLGPNGAGKSTLFNLISGNLRPSGGKILLGGDDVTSLAPWHRVKRGIGRTFQIPKPFGSMTVLENIAVAATFGAGSTLGAAQAEARAVLEITQLSHRRDAIAGSLSLLDLKRLELAKALATNPKVLLLDEIAGGLTDGECVDLIEIIRTTVSEGVTVVWIEHVVHALMRISTRLAVVADGGLIAEGDPGAVLTDTRVQEIYLGVVE